MKLHEYQAKRLFREFGIAVPEAEVAASADAAVAAARTLGGSRWAVKAQVHAGGRGKGGGVSLVDGTEALHAEASRLIGSRLVTPQTGPEGLPVDRLLIEAPTEIARELYLGVLVDRGAERVVMMGSDAGGMAIEEVAARSPERIHRLWVDPAAGLQPYQCRRMGFALGLDAGQIGGLQAIMAALHRLFIETDATLVEINPLVVTAGGGLVALDAKLNLDDNALFRHPELASLRDESQEDPREAAARAHDLSYITLDGEIGCMVNGAGLAMATMDLVKLHGGEPANFLDVGGGTTAERVAEAFKLLLSDPKVKAVLVNIFGGIVRCDLIAEGIVQAVQQIDLRVPVVVRLEGTNAEQGLARLAESGLALSTASDLDEAAERVVAAARGA
jgi:succinyl-CoA synthetase beta subunit